VRGVPAKATGGYGFRYRKHPMGRRPKSGLTAAGRGMDPTGTGPTLSIFGPVGMRPGGSALPEPNGAQPPGRLRRSPSAGGRFWVIFAQLARRAASTRISLLIQDAARLLRCQIRRLGGGLAGSFFAERASVTNYAVMINIIYLKLSKKDLKKDLNHPHRDACSASLRFMGCRMQPAVR
jgi:hypothetical protein